MDDVERRDLLHRGDVDELVRTIDAAAGRRDWATVEALRVGCREALERTGRQLWGPAAFAAYRLALDAPPVLAARAVAAGHDRHTLGPLTEVVAQHHEWDDLAPHLPPGPLRGVVAVERVARGEDLRSAPDAEVHHLAVPAAWQPWEGRPPVPTYRPDSLSAPAPERAAIGDWETVTAAPAREVADPVLDDAMEAIVGPWTRASSGDVAIVAADGPAGAAMAALVAGTVRLRPITLDSAVAWLTWAAADGAARGPRRGVAAGRSATWWLLRCLVEDLVDDPDELDDSDELEYQLASWRWYEADTGRDDGWRLQLAGTHPDGWSIALDAHDRASDDDGTIQDTVDP